MPLTLHLQRVHPVFGFMLMVLAVLSVVWHSSNAPTAQYIDLWSMDSCIVYLIVRITCIGAVSALRAASIARHTAEDVSAWCCAVLFFCLVCTNALYWRANYRARWLHGGKSHARSLSARLEASAISPDGKPGVEPLQAVRLRVGLGFRHR